MSAPFFAAPDLRVPGGARTRYACEVVRLYAQVLAPQYLDLEALRSPAHISCMFPQSMTERMRIGTRNFVLLQEVYNTQGWSDCPADVWDTITPESVDEQYGSYQAELNGPRFWYVEI